MEGIKNAIMGWIVIAVILFAIFKACSRPSCQSAKAAEAKAEQELARATVKAPGTVTDKQRALREAQAETREVCGGL